MRCDEDLYRKVASELDYDPLTGLFRWSIHRKSRPMARVVGTDKGLGYLYVKKDKRYYALHVLAFLKMYDYIPEEVDHKDRDNSNNRIDNLRPSNKVQNQANRAGWNKLGHKNIQQTKSGKFRVSLRRQREVLFDKSFDNLELATLVAQEAREHYHGEFANHGHKQETTHSKA